MHTRAAFSHVGDIQIYGMNRYFLIRNVGVVGSNPIISTTEIVRAGKFPGPYCITAQVADDGVRSRQGYAEFASPIPLNRFAATLTLAATGGSPCYRRSRTDEVGKPLTCFAFLPFQLSP